MYCVKNVRVLVRIFPHSYWIQRDREYLSIQSKYGEMGTRISPNKAKWWHFSHSDCCLNNCGEYDDLEEVLIEVTNFQIKKSTTKTKRVTQQTIVFFYTRMMNFPNSDFWISTFTTNGFYTNCALINNNQSKFAHILTWAKSSRLCTWFFQSKS